MEENRYIGGILAIESGNRSVAATLKNPFTAAAKRVTNHAQAATAGWGKSTVAAAAVTADSTPPPRSGEHAVTPSRGR